MSVGTKVALTGNEAAAEALRQVDPDVAAAFPITPQTELMHQFAAFIANGQVKTELITVESEHSAMSACVGASAAGARVATATSANGLALMWEIVYIAASTRLPIVMPVVNRALSGPINIHCDHSDSMGCRDSGWIQIYSENAQEVYDNTVQAFRIAEDKSVLLPVMVTLDGFILSHTMETLEILSDEKVKKFVGDYVPQDPLLDTEHPVTYGPLDLQDFYFEHKRQQVEAMDNARDVILEIGKEYEKLSGRPSGFFEGYMLDDADYVIVCLGSTAGTTKATVDVLREKGVKAGLLKVRVFRPFPGHEIADALSNAKAVAVLDRSISFGLEGGPLFNEVRSFCYKNTDIPLASYIYGLGGRDINIEQLSSVYEDLARIISTGEMVPVQYIGLRE